MGASFALHLLALLALPCVLVGVINRVKALWSGRKGPPILQLAYDLARLVRKVPVYSATTTPIFRLAPYVVLGTALASGLVVPLLGTAGPLSFAFDFVWFAYVWGLGRVALMLGALDTGSSFEGMGASREATYAAILEPALFLVAGALCLVTGQRSLAGALALHLDGGAALVVWLASIVALVIVVQVEAARMPVDDPATHLELTMIHEVMVLDHSGPELAAVQLGAAVKLTAGIGLIAALCNPWAGSARWAVAAVANVLLCLVVAVFLGSVESLVARLKLRAVPQYILAALIAGGIALLAATWRLGGQE
jgi:formate hydrogenlyase subunit 4